MGQRRAIASPTGSPRCRPVPGPSRPAAAGPRRRCCGACAGARRRRRGTTAGAGPRRVGRRRGHSVEIPKSCVVGGLEHEWIMTFHSVGNFIIPTYGFMSLENPNDLVALGVHPRHRKWRTYNPCIYIIYTGLEHEWIMTFHSVGNFIIPTYGFMSLETPNDLVALGVHPRHRKWRTYNPCVYIYILVWNMNGL